MDSVFYALFRFQFFSGILLSYKKFSDYVLMIKSYISSVTYSLITWNLLECIWHASHVIILGSDIERNPSLKHSFSSQDLKICHYHHHTCARKFLFCQTTRSSHQRCSVKKVVLRNFAKFTGKHLRQSLFFNKVANKMPTIKGLQVYGLQEPTYGF